MPVGCGVPGTPMKPAFVIPPFTLAPLVTLIAGRIAPNGFVRPMKVPAPEAAPGVSAILPVLVRVTLSGPLLPAVKLPLTSVEKKSKTLTLVMSFVIAPAVKTFG